MELTDVERFLIEAQREPRTGGLARVILNRPEAETTTWPALLGGPELDEADESARDALRERLVEAALRAVAIAARAGVLIPAERLARKLLPRKESKPGHPSAIPESPLVFRSLMKTIAARQPYIPASG